MGSYNNMVITSVGQALLTSVLGSQGTLTFSKFQTSSYQYSGGTDLSALTSLNSVQQEVTPSSAGVIDANNLYVSSSVDNDSLATGYTAYTLGIFASDGNSEVLFGVSTAVTPDVIPADTGGTPSTYTYRMQLAVSSTADITIAVETGAYALAVDLTDHVNSDVLEADGVHGIRAVLDNGSYKVQVNVGGTWTDASGSIGSIIMVTTGSEELFGATVTLTIGASTYTGTFSNNGTCVFYGITDTGAATVSVIYGITTYTDTFSISSFGFYTAEINVPYIYGASWDGTSTTAWSRTDDAVNFVDPVPYVAGATSYGSPFDNIMPWKGMKKITSGNNTVVAIPKFWYKMTQNGAGIKIQIANKKVDGFDVCPACMDRGDGKGERDVVYVGRYHCASDYTSKTGVMPVANITRSTARSSIHNTGNNIWQMDFAMRFTLWLLYIVEFADWNSQEKIGYGCGNNSNTVSMGYTDSMPYHTGTTKAARTTYGNGTQYRNIEGLWDNVRDWCDGCYYNGNGLNIILNPSNFSDSSNGISVGTPTSGYPSALSVKNVSGTFKMFIPTAASGNGDTYTCDEWGYISSNACVYAGGDFSQIKNFGLFFFHGAPTTYTYVGIGCRVMELP